MNSYKLIKIVDFPSLIINETITTKNNGSLPGFTREPCTKIKYINNSYYGFQYYEIEHELLIKESGIAYGFLNDEPQVMEFINYLKPYLIKCLYNSSKGYAYLSAPAVVVNDLVKLIRKNEELKTEIVEVDLDMQLLKEHVEDYLGAWFRGVSSRVSSSALFGSDLVHDPLYEQLLTDGAILTSVFIPYQNMTIQLNNKAGISSKQKIENIIDEITIIEKIKNEIIDKIIIA